MLQSDHDAVAPGPRQDCPDQHRAPGLLRGVVIVAPIRVIRLVWRQEAMKWSHTKHLTFSMLTGTKDQRTRALLRPANIFLINYENLGWLAEVLQTYFISKDRPIPFDGLVWDEISKCKNSRLIELGRKIRPTSCQRQATGPASNFTGPAYRTSWLTGRAQAPVRPRSDRLSQGRPRNAPRCPPRSSS